MQTRLVCNNLIYHNALKSELSGRIINAKKIASSFKSKFETGDAGILEYNKAQVNLLNLVKDAESAEIERNALLSELQNLNGGFLIEFTDSVYPVQSFATDFEQWYSRQKRTILYYNG